MNESMDNPHQNSSCKKLKRLLPVSVFVFGVILVWAMHLIAQPVQATKPAKWLGQAWNNFEICENFQACNETLPQVEFLNYSICELQNFKNFYDRFSEDTVFQISVTKFPLKLTNIIPPWEAEAGAEEIKYLALPKNINSLQLFPIQKQREYEHLYATYTLEGSVATIHLRKEDTGVSKYYVFTWNRCWILTEIMDNST